MPREHAPSTASWRALAHPVRLAIFERLMQRDTARARDLAEIIDEPANSVSFHLRQLARHGLVEEHPDPPSSDARERWWRLAVTDTRVQADEDDAAGLQAVETLSGVMRQQYRDVVEDWFRRVSLEEPSDEEVNTNLVLRLTADEVAVLRAQLREAFEGAIQTSRAHADDDAAEYRVMLLAAREDDLRRAARTRTR